MQQFVIKFNHKDPQAVLWMYNKAHPYVTGLAVRFSGEDGETVDLALDVLTILLEHPRPFETFKEIRLFLYKTARNMCLNSCKRRKIIKSGLSGIEDDWLSEFDEDYQYGISEAEMRGLIYESVEKFPPKMRKIFKMSYYNEMTNEAISKQLGMPEKTVANQKSNARQRLRRDLRNIKRFISYLLNIFYESNRTSTKNWSADGLLCFW
jgi:RNA polymerase sigma factor (sigma-70 family)